LYREAVEALEILTSPYWNVSKVLVWIAVVFVVLYVLSPIDLISESHVAAIGLIDDLALIVWLMLVIRMFMRYG
jgi:uncharacterized membrane protein YkvA (DUF1232 family)